MSSDLAIHLHAVRKQYQDHVAVRDLSLAVPRGTVYGLLGPNGAGKTSTIRMLMHIIAPDAGTIEVLGRPASDPGLTDRVGYLPEERGLYRKMRVRDVLAFLARLKGVPRREVGPRIDAWLERFQLRGQGADWSTARVDELSRGMQQKVQFIGALLHDPELVILDEPFSGLDPVNAQALKDTVLDLRARGRTVVFSTHVMENAERMCDAVCIIARGEKVLDGTVASVRDAHASRLVSLTFETTPEGAVLDILQDPASVRRAPLASRHLEVELHDHIDAGPYVQRLPGAAEPAPHLPRTRRHAARRDGDAWPWLSRSSSRSSRASTSSAYARGGSWRPRC
ncbi:MAG: ATP-binding cassette domain-containing protein [Gemmatimonadaceae bacterium]|nr:ATP-binding cassette domain-containing protein [Gemmatimonadaceae bacterium]